MVQTVFLFCVPLGRSCHWNTAVYRVCAGQYVGNVRAVDLLPFLPEEGRAARLSCFQYPFIEFIEEPQRLKAPTLHDISLGAVCQWVYEFLWLP